MRLTRMWQIWTVLATATVAGGIGCGRKGPAESSSKRSPAIELSIPNNATPTAPAKVQLDQTFAEAVLEESPGNQQRPVDTTIAGLSTAKLRDEVQAAWPSIRFTSSTGKPIIHIAHFDTEFGKVQVRLLHEVAPNHVRNFVALARAGYYDGLVFEQVIQTQIEDTSELLELVEGGCPLGTGEQGAGHLGYWLRPEFSDAIKHEPGIMGAVHDENPNTAACRFYITLSQASGMDGQFTAYGKVVAGLDVIRTISKRAKTDAAAAPIRPAVIRFVTIETQAEQ